MREQLKIMKIIKFHANVTKIMKISEFNARLTKIMKPINPTENHENHKDIRIQYENYKKQKHRIPHEIYANHENHRIS